MNRCCLILALPGAVAAALAAPALAQSFDYVSQNRKVFVQARPVDDVGESAFRFAPAFDPFEESISASWQITEPAAHAGAEAQQNSILSAQSISAAGSAFALASAETVFASSFSFFEAVFTVAQPTPVALNAAVGGAASFLLQGPGIDLQLSSDTILTTRLLEPGEYLLRVDLPCAPTAPGEQSGSFNVGLSVIPAPATALLGTPALLLATRRRRAAAM